MFGKNDTLVDNGYRHTTKQPAAQNSEFGHAGGDFMTAPQSAAAQQYPTPQHLEPQHVAPEHIEPQAEAPAFAAAPTESAPYVPTATQTEFVSEQPQHAVSSAPPSTSQTKTMSFSEMMARRGQQSPAAETPSFDMEAEQENYQEAYAEAPAETPAEAPAEEMQHEVYSAPEAPAEEAGFEMPAEAPAAEALQETYDSPLAYADAAPQMDEPAPEAEATAEAPQESYDIPADMGAEITETPTQAPAAEETTEQMKALQLAYEALTSEEIDKTSGKTRVQAAALKVLVEKAYGQDENALSQLSTHGFELLEKVAEGLPPASHTLDKLVESVGALVGNELIVAADSKAQQTDALLGIAQGVGLQGQVAAIQHEQTAEERSFAAREAEKKSTRQEDLPTGQYL